MSISGTDAYAKEVHLPPLVERALAAARAHGFAHSRRPEQGRLLYALAGGAGTLIGETGTGCGVGLAWLAAGAGVGVRLVGVERDPERARVAAEVFADRPEVEVLCGDWRRIEERGPYDLLVLNGGGSAKTEDDSPADPARLLAPAGRMVIDDFAPAADWPPLHEGAVDRARLHWLRHSALETIEIPLARDLATLVATRRRIAGAETSWRGFEQGQVVRGIVSRIESFGVFVDLDGTEGFITAPELSRHHIDSFDEVVHVGQEINAEVLAFELFRPQVRLSLAALAPDPLAEFARNGGLGRVVRGQVTKVVPFGVFVRVAEGVEGLVHCDLLGDSGWPDAGDEMSVEVIDINLRLRRVALTPLL
ncbi:S1 RNA-binding domain-containing protein [Streptomyces bicolor]|uniref:S1 RNA-binding domain-containing protein n=1 Tax=Streptomyces bicolor TaxID=66874 RepID=UPI0009965047|nr:S1 RNA-binding domain-containing protein [Streptomyces bicolor]